MSKNGPRKLIDNAAMSGELVNVAYRCNSITDIAKHFNVYPNHYYRAYIKQQLVDLGFDAGILRVNMLKFKKERAKHKLEEKRCISTEISKLLAFLK